MIKVLVTYTFKVHNFLYKKNVSIFEEYES